jgi:hypothetical protein
MLRARNIGLGLLLGAVLAACGNAKVIRRDQYGGVIELQGDRSKAMEQANGLMNQHCQGPFTIVSEGEEAIGTDTYTREDSSDTSHVSRSGRTATNDSTTVGQSSTRTATAWRVHYACGQGAPPPGAGGPPPGPGPGPGAPPPGY